MKHKAICLLLSAVILIAALSACGKKDEEKSGDADDDAGTAPTYVDGGHPLYIRTENSADSMDATFLSTESGETCTVRMEQIDSGDGYTEFCCSADTSVYDRVVLSGDRNASQLAFNDNVSGWVLNAYGFWPYTYGEEITEPQYERVTFDYEDRDKGVLIWTPADYDAASSEKYSVIYMTDAQNLFDPSCTSTGSWAVAESVLSMAKNGGEKCIIVGIENADDRRDSELTPDIGEVTDKSFMDGHGAYFSDFVVNTVMPYINEHYNVHTDREHTHVCGSSSGGIESFYIAMEHPDKFASVGALSPAFVLYSDATWDEYLGKKDFSENAVFVYLYCGNNASDELEQALYPGTVSMRDNLKKIGYPEEKIVVKLNEKAMHCEMYWRAVFPDYLKYAFQK